MRRRLILAVLAAVAVGGAASGAGNGPRHRAPTILAAFPAVQPPGYYANRYHYEWPYPWFAYYDYSHGPYANWMAGGGYAYYEGLGHNQPNPPYPGYIGGPQYGGQHGGSGGGAGATPATDSSAPAAGSAAGTVCITLPADATLKFNGTAAAGTGATRTFRTPPLEAGREYAYELTAEVVRDGQTVTATERVVVRAGRETKVTLAPAAGVAAK